jgi:hypothetical protein
LQNDQKQNSGTGTECSGKFYSGVDKTDGVQQTGVQNSISDTQVQKEK